MSQPSTLDDLLTVAQVAQKYHLRDSTIRAYIKKGLLLAQKTPGGKNWLIRGRDAAARLSPAPAPGVAPADLPPGLIPAGTDPQSVRPKSPLIDRLGTPEGRAHAIAVIRQLGEDWDEGEQRDSWEQMSPPLEVPRTRMRLWDLETGERLDAE